MILQYKVESIVMLTSLVEENKIKCHEYFPKLDSQVKFDNIAVTCASQEVLPTFIKLLLEVERVSIKLFLDGFVQLKVAE